MYCTVREIPYLDKIEKEIHKVIHEKGRIRWTQLKKIICDNKKICSERIFREKLNGMVERNLVFKLELGKTNVVYSTESSLEKSEKSRISYFYIFLKASFKNLEAFEKKMDKMSDTEKSDILVSFLKIILLLEWGFNETLRLTANPKIKDQVSMLDEIKSRITKLVEESKQNDVEQIVQKIIYSETINSFIEFEEKLRDVKRKK